MTYLILFLYTLLAPKEGKSAQPHPRQIMTTAMGLTWCSRLGTYLFERVLIHGKDERFDKVKYMPARFAL
jgi:steroid 5-alpha reductase family enzyme